MTQPEEERVTSDLEGPGHIQGFYHEERILCPSLALPCIPLPSPLIPAISLVLWTILGRRIASH